MENWKELEGKRVYLRLKNGRIYSGSIDSIDQTSKPLIFIHLTDKFGYKIILLSSEILELREESK